MGPWGRIGSHRSLVPCRRRRRVRRLRLLVIGAAAIGAALGGGRDGWGPAIGIVLFGIPFCALGIHLMRRYTTGRRQRIGFKGLPALGHPSVLLLGYEFRCRFNWRGLEDAVGSTCGESAGRRGQDVC